MVIIYPICVPFSYWFMLYRLRTLINGGQLVKEEVLDRKKSAHLALLERAKNEDENPSLKSMRFLYENYQPKYWWFEVCETLRKLSLTGFLVFLAPGTGLQICIAMMITIFSLHVYGSLKPFQDPYANRLAMVAQYQLLVTLFCALAIKVKMDGLQDHQSFDAFLTCVQVIPVSLVTFYFVGMKVHISREEGSASVLPILPAEGEEMEKEEVKEEEDDDNKECNTRAGQNTTSIGGMPSDNAKDSDKNKAKRLDPTLFKLLTTRREEKT
jgi:hypothetical protein